MRKQPFGESLPSHVLTRHQSERQAREMLEAFAGVGVKSFALTRTTVQKKGVGSPVFLSYEEAHRNVVGTVWHAEYHGVNIMVRPLECPVPLVQLDDLDLARLGAFAGTAFLAVCTSPNNFQAWLAVEGADEHFRSRLKRGIGADTGANECVRLSGTRNLKEEYAPNFPFVLNGFINPGRIVPRADLEALCAVAPAPRRAAAKAPPGGSSRPRRPKRFPDYQRCLQGAPDARSHAGKDRSRADYLWIRQALEWGWSEDAVVAELLLVSDRARERGEQYASREVARVAKKGRTTGGGS